jgi:hypothetical protein
MRDLRLANVPAPSSLPEGAALRLLPLSRAALVLSVLVHVVGAYVASQWSWTPELPVLPAPTTEFWFVPPVPPSAPQEVEPAREELVPVPLEPASSAIPQQADVREAAPPPSQPSAAESEPRVAESAPSGAPTEPSSSPSPLAPRITRLELEEARQQAASAVVEGRATDDEFLTFSVDDVAPPRAAPAEERRSIFDGTGSARVNGTTVGRQRTRVGRRVAELCNALTGGFSFMGLGSFCGEASDEPSGLFPEVRPEILDLMPECEETRPLAEQLGETSQFPTVKCELVPKKELPERWELP